MLHAAQRKSFDQFRVLHQFGIRLHALPYFKQHCTSQAHFPCTLLWNHSHTTTRLFDSNKIKSHMFKGEVCLSFQSHKPPRSQNGACSVESLCCSALSGFVVFLTCSWVKFTELCPEMNPVCKQTLFLSCREESRHLSSACLSVCLPLSVSLLWDVHLAALLLERRQNRSWGGEGKWRADTSWLTWWLLSGLDSCAVVCQAQRLHNLSF